MVENQKTWNHQLVKRRSCVAVYIYIYRCVCVCDTIYSTIMYNLQHVCVTYGVNMCKPCHPIVHLLIAKKGTSLLRCEAQGLSCQFLSEPTDFRWTQAPNTSFHMGVPINGDPPNDGFFGGKSCLKNWWKRGLPPFMETIIWCTAVGLGIKSISLHMHWFSSFEFIWWLQYIIPLHFTLS